MSILDSTQFKSQTQTLFPTNNIGSITAANLRTQMDNIADSAMFVSVGHTSAPTANDDDSDTAGNGAFQVGHGWVDETNNVVYVCVDNTTGAAQWKLITSSASVVPNQQTQITASTYTITNADLTGDRILMMNNATGVTVTVPESLTGTEPVTIIQTNVGTVTFVGSGAANIRSLDSKVDAAGLYASVTLIPDKLASDEFILIGALA